MKIVELETLKEYTRWVGKWCAIALLVTWTMDQAPLGRDDSDEQGWFGARSGMSPMTDRLTGCQYLSTSSGGITPRLGADGRHLGCK